MVEVDDFDPLRQLVGKKRPVIAGAVGHFDERHVGGLLQRVFDFGSQLALEHPLFRLRHARKTHRAQALAFCVVKTDRAATDLTVARGAADLLALLPALLPLGLALAVLHRRHHAIERDADHRHLSHRCFLRLQLTFPFPTPHLPTFADALRQPVQRTARGVHAAQLTKQILALQ